MFWQLNIYLAMAVLGIYLALRVGFSMKAGFNYLPVRYMIGFGVGELYMSLGLVMYLVDYGYRLSGLCG